jgi:ABC-type branched-subunit amino acid transport system substrate-binding protein
MHDVGSALARFAIDDLRVTNVAVVDDGTPEGIAMRDRFEATLEAMDGTVAGRFDTFTGIDDDLPGLLDPDVEAVMVAGWDIPAWLDVRRVLDRAGRRDVPLLGGPALSNGFADDPASFAYEANRLPRPRGPIYAADPLRSDFPGWSEFAERMLDEQGIEPGWYGDGAYVCAEVLLQAIEEAAADGSISREAVRANTVEPDRPFSTAWGRVSFDAHGDAQPQAHTIWRLDKGARDWRWETQLEFRTD